MALTPPLLHVARLAVTRLGAASNAVCVTVAGQRVGIAKTVATEFLAGASLSISDALNDLPNTANVQAKGFAPLVGQPVIVTLGSYHRYSRLFAGRVMRTALQATGPLSVYRYQIAATDWTAFANAHKVTARFTNTSATGILQTLVATYAPTGYTARHVVAGLPVLDEITFTAQDLNTCITQTMNRINGNWYWDYGDDNGTVSALHAFIDPEPGFTNPTDLTATHRTLQDLVVTRDLSQWITRMVGQGGGANAIGEIAVGETILPVETIAWYEDTGGTVISGPQLIVYTGRSAGGDGSLVGPGASPAAAPLLALAAGAGVETGAHSYAVTFVTGAGESVASPLRAITVGAVAAPPVGATVGVATAGGSVTAGAHSYAVTFVTAAGETTPSPTTGPVTTGDAVGEISAPGSAPTAGAPTAGGAVTTGTHSYAVTFVNAAGETTASPSSGTVTTIINTQAAPSANATTPTNDSLGAGTLTNGATYRWKYTFRRISDDLESGSSAASGSLVADGHYVNLTTAGVDAPPSGYEIQWYRTGPNGSTYFRANNATNEAYVPGFFIDRTPDGSLGAAEPPSGGQAYATVPLTNIPTGPSGVTSRKVYRTAAGGSQLKLLATIANNSTTTYSDTIADGSLGANIPTSNTTSATANVVPLTAIPIGGALVTSRKLYRTAAAGSQLKLLATIANNTATTYNDSIADGSLGANVPTSNTATANQVSLTAIPIGGATVTNRKLYRTVAALSQLKLLATLADNSTTTYTDSMADASLGANVPTSDTSGLTQPTGQVGPGATSLIVAGTAAFSSTGGWAVIGNGQQVVRYTGITGSTLTGIPASGAGAITASIGYNSTVTASPVLTGVPASGTGSVRYTIKRGDPVNLWEQVDDLASQADLAASLGGGDGVRDDYLVDRRLSRTELRARMSAQIALRNAVDIAISYTSRDPNTRSGRTVRVNIGAPYSLDATFTIQRVTIANALSLIGPTYAAEASVLRVSFDDVLRRLVGNIVSV